MGKRKKGFGKDRLGGDRTDNPNLKNNEDIDLGIIRDILKDSLTNGRAKSAKYNKEVLISILQKAQAAYNYIPRGVINEINEQTGIATSKIFGIVTFYDEFSTEKRGKYTVKSCSGTACQVKGGKQSMDTIKKELGIEVGETTEDYTFSLETAGCLGACAIAPTMLVNKQLYGRATQEKVAPIIEQLSKK